MNRPVIGIDPCYGAKSVMGMVYLIDEDVHDYVAKTYDTSGSAKRWRGSTKGWYVGTAEAITLAWGLKTERVTGVTPLVAIEAPFGTNFSTHGLREMVGMLKDRFVQWGWDVVEVPAASAKKALSDKGNAKKDEMVAAAAEVWPEIYNVGNQKQQEAVADAIGIAMAGEEKWEDK